MPSLQCHIPTFGHVLDTYGIAIKRQPITTLQINVGKVCNQSCTHCHVEAGPLRSEMMEATTFQRLVELLQNAPGVHTVDITGGAPELNPHFRTFVRTVHAMGRTLLHRCNLSVLFEPGQEDTAAFLAEHGVEVIASLPCYLEANVNRQRGEGVFDKSIRGLHLLNGLGYGQPGSSLKLNLVYNPGGVHLPPSQSVLEESYRQQLAQHYGILFNHLYTLTNIPVTRYARHLRQHGQYDDYMQLLVDNFNPAAAHNLMCMQQVSVAWDGSLYDCDFNQMANLPIGGTPLHIWNVQNLEHIPRSIATAEHCFGCTAGAGSSCGGAIA
ncbi:arsenosugar biosynthesis radical SAM protein ArsS [Desulfurispirillum indicum]|uniref:arsenosugar biosynthesis radical SAM (seleno)protein ArsS n=1 Tax=Desulfurispirillum indicum TaxID=936456 RepID=UPI001CFB20B4|nr:arsenosugar biosynthesis radical SAM (seleno)protein ArsS [Desulfurispirillum indicum]UCZ56986.1 arsenosugar biosynthesis radical SAM protein ArsS [Desulfurispirillum indicum]